MNFSYMEQVYQFVKENQNYFVSLLAQAVAIPSVSATADHRPDVFRMCEWLESNLKRLGVSYELRHPGKQHIEGKEIDLPPVILARYGNDVSKKTVLVYGHYDVQPAAKEEGWSTDPWVLTEDDQGRLFGRGSTDDKGPVISWLWVIEVYQKLGLDLPVNLVMCFEGMEESGSEGLDEIIFQEADKYFKGVDCVCISDNCKPFIFIIVKLLCNCSHTPLHIQIG